MARLFARRFDAMLCFAWLACVGLRVVIVFIVSFPAQIRVVLVVIATINANATIALTFGLLENNELYNNGNQQI